MPSAGSALQTGVFPLVRYYVFMKKTWDGQWFYQPYAKPRSYDYVAAPMISRGEILFDFGYIDQEDVVPTPPSSVPSTLYSPYTAGPWYVMIATQLAGLPTVVGLPNPAKVSIHWVGQVAEDTVTVDRPTVSSGKQVLQCYGFEHFLDRCFITKSYVKQDSTEGSLDHVLPFNERHERGASVFGNQSGLVDSNGVYRFYDPTDPSAPGRWTNLEITQYLLQYFVNTLPDGTASPIKFKMAGQTSALQAIMDTYDFMPKDKPVSVWQALNQLIDRRRGLGFVLRSSGLPGAIIYIWVYSLTESPITAGGITLPANGEQISFSIPNVAPYDNLVGEVPLRYSTTNLFDSILVQGERIRVTGSFRKRQGTLEAGWTDALQTLYENVDDDVRSHEKYRSVFAYYKVPKDWNWYVMDEEGSTHNLLLDADDDGTVSADRNDNDVIGYNYLKTFERDLPISEGWDYTANDAADKNPVGTEPEYVKIMAICPLGEDEDHFYFAEKGSEQEDELPNCSVRALDTCLGVEIKASPSYLIALNHFNPVGGHEGEEEEALDYDNIIVTASIYSDVRPRVLLSRIAVPTPETKNQLTITLPDCHYWYVSPKTIYDVDDDGHPVAFMSKSAVKDDTGRLRQVAAYLRWWFSRSRQALTIPIKMPGQFAQPGQLITTLNTAWTREPVNAVVTARKVNFELGITEITTSYLELDSMVALLDDPQRRTRGSWGVKDARR